MNSSKKSESKLAITPKTSEKEKLTLKSKSSSTAPRTLSHQLPLPPADPYIAVKDAVWKDVVVHERKLDMVWKDTWTPFILPRNGRIPKPPPSSKPSDMAQEKMSPATKRKLVFAKSSDIYGRFGVNHVVLQKEQDMAQPPLVSRIRFVPQQYGRYRRLKYVADAKGAIARKEEDILRLPTSKVRHTVNPLLC